MFKNRFVLIVAVLSVLLVTMAVSLPGFDAVILSMRGAQEAQPYELDSATRSYIAQGQAILKRNELDSATRSYIAWGEAAEKARYNALDTATRGYIAWGKALEAAGKMPDLDH